MIKGLLVKRGPNCGTTFPLNDTHPIEGIHFDISDGITTIGRGIENDIQINDPKISRQHCQIFKENSAYHIRDLNSRNRIKVNNHVTSDTVIQVGDEILIGDSVLVFTEHEEDDTKHLNIEQSKHNLNADKTVEFTLKDTSRVLDPEFFKPETIRNKKAYNRLLSLYNAGNILHAIRDLPTLFDVTIETIFSVVRADRGILMMYDPASEEMIPKVVKHRDEPLQHNATIKLHQSLIHRIINDQEAIMCHNILESKIVPAWSSPSKAKQISLICAPIRVRHQLIGLLYLDKSQDPLPFDEQDFHLLVAIASQAAIAIESCQLFDGIHSLFLDTIRTLVAMVDAKDSYTRGHSDRVAILCVMIAEELGLDQIEKETLRLSSLLHDIGKIWIPEEIMNKKTPLTHKELDSIREHPVSGSKALSHIDNLEEVVYSVRHHHERFDGTGYPDGLEGKDIPLFSRIIAVADAYDAMISKRSYRDARKKEEAIQEIKQCVHTQFDPEVVDAFIRAMNRSPFVFPEHPVGDSDANNM